MDARAVRPLAHPVSLATFKADPLRSQPQLLGQSWLSVAAITPEEYARVAELGG